MDSISGGLKITTQTSKADAWSLRGCWTQFEQDLKISNSEARALMHGLDCDSDIPPDHENEICSIRSQAVSKSLLKHPMTMHGHCVLVGTDLSQI